MTLRAYRGKGKQPWRWRLVASNGKIVADSAEGYATKSSLARAIRRFTKTIGDDFIRVVWA